ncbi:MAG: extracellular solute-binding protein [Candidatus Promineifilaceae bacterium]
MKSNKFFLIVVVLLLGALVLSACGGTQPAEQAADQAAEAVDQAAEAVDEAAAEVEEAMEEPTAEPTEEMMEEPTAETMEEPTAEPEMAEESAPAETSATLTIWAHEKAIPVLETLVDDFAETAGVEVVLEQVQIQDMLEQTRVAIPAGEGPDIFVTAHDQIGQLVEGGLVAPLDLGAKADDITPVALQAFNYNSQLYALPFMTENVALYRNVDLVPEPVETWDEFIEVGSQLVADGTVENITVIPSQYASHGMHTAFGGYLFGQDADGNYLPDDVGLDSPGFIAFGDWLQQAADDGYISTTIDYATANALFAEGKIPFILNGPWSLGEYEEAGINFAVDPVPAGPAGPGAPFLGAQGFLVNAQGDNVLLAQTFLTELVATDEVMDQLFELDPRIPAWIPTLEKVDNPYLAAFGVAGENAQPMPAIPQMGAVWGSWQDGLQLILNDEPVEETLTNAANQIREAIAGE